MRTEPKNDSAPVFVSRFPGAGLVRDVTSLWYYSGPAQPHAFERVLPGGGSQLIVNLRADSFGVYPDGDSRRRERRRGVLLVGPRANSTLIETGEAVEYIAAVFRPGGARAFVGRPMRELLNEELDAEAIWGGTTNELRDRLRSAKAIQGRFEILEGALLGVRDARFEPNPAVAWALHQFAKQDQRPLSALVEQTGYSARHFISLFTSEVGLAPKRYQRLQRFQRTARALYSGCKANLATAALDCGYYDQAHLNHDFRAFAGLTPVEYLARRSGHPNHVEGE